MKYGQVKELEFAKIDGIRYNEATILVNVEKGVEMPGFFFK